MKRFIFSVLAVAVFCVGLGTIVERASATFKSDEKALAIVRDARQAIGGETALVAVRSMVIAGNVTRTIKVDGVEKTIQGESEIAMQLPDKLMRTIALKDGDGTKGGKALRQVDVVVVGDKKKGEGNGIGIGAEPGQKIIIKKSDGNGGDDEKVIIRKAEGDKTQVDAEIEKAISNGDGERVMIKRSGVPDHEAMEHNEMLRLTLGLLLTPPHGMDVNYIYGGEISVDGTACNIVVAEAGGSAFKLFIGKSSNLPVMMTYKGMKMPNVVMFRSKAPEGAAPKETATFTRKVEAPEAETAEFTVKFSEYRSVNGLQLPFKWTQTVDGTTDEVFDVNVYDINPANIAEKFNNDNLKVKVLKDAN